MLFALNVSMKHKDQCVTCCPFQSKSFQRLFLVLEAHFPQEFWRACLQLKLWDWVYNIAQSHHFHIDHEASKHQMINLILQTCCSYTLTAQLLPRWRQKHWYTHTHTHSVFLWHLDVALHSPNYPWLPPYLSPHHKAFLPLISCLLLTLLSFPPESVYMPGL